VTTKYRLNVSEVARFFKETFLKIAAIWAREAAGFAAILARPTARRLDQAGDIAQWRIESACGDGILSRVIDRLLTGAFGLTAEGQDKCRDAEPGGAEEDILKRRQHAIECPR